MALRKRSEAKGDGQQALPGAPPASTGEAPPGVDSQGGPVLDKPEVFHTGVPDGETRAPVGGQFVSHNGVQEDGSIGPRLSEDFEQIVARVFNVDALREYERLEAELKLGEQRGDYGSLQKALDEAEDNARIAHKIWVSAKAEHEKFERDFEVIQAPMWSEANAFLQEQKDKGARSKAITDADVKARAAELYPDEYRANAVRAARVKGMVEQTKKLSELWTNRCATLATLLAHRRH